MVVLSDHDARTGAMAQIDSVTQAFKAIRRRAGLIVALVLIGSMAVLYVATTRDRVYEAVAVVQIETPQIALGLGEGGRIGAETPIDSRLSLIEQRLMSRASLAQIITDFDLFSQIDDSSGDSRITAMRQAVIITRIFNQAESWRPDRMPTGLSIVVRLDDPQIAADVANHFVTQIMTEGRNRATVQAESTLAFFAAEEARVGAQIAGIENRIAALKTEFADALPETAPIRADQMRQLNEAQLSLEQQVVSFEQGRDRLRSDEAQRQDAILREQRALVAARIAALTAQNQIAPEVERQLNQLERDRTRLQQEFAAITARRSEAAMTQVLESREQSSRFEVLEIATPPQWPINASRGEVLATGVAAVILGALVFALSLEWLSPRLRTSDQIERALGIRPVVVIPDLRVPRGRRLI
jgi:tyrosine-protein kinase Etk/Wzc